MYLTGDAYSKLYMIKLFAGCFWCSSGSIRESNDKESCRNFWKIGRQGNQSHAGQ